MIHFNQQTTKKTSIRVQKEDVYRYRHPNLEIWMQPTAKGNYKQQFGRFGHILQT